VIALISLFGWPISYLGGSLGMPDIPENPSEYTLETRGLTRRLGSILAVDDLAGRWMWPGALLRRYAYSPD
jgi:hypothetical protein